MVVKEILFIQIRERYLYRILYIYRGVIDPLRGVQGTSLHTSMWDPSFGVITRVGWIWIGPLSLQILVAIHHPSPAPYV